MALNEGDKAICAEIAGEVFDKILPRLFTAHTDACQHGKALLKIKAKFIGLCIGIGVGSGIGSTSIFMVLMKAFSQ